MDMIDNRTRFQRASSASLYAIGVCCLCAIVAALHTDTEGQEYLLKSGLPFAGALLTAGLAFAIELIVQPELLYISEENGILTVRHMESKFYSVVFGRTGKELALPKSKIRGFEIAEKFGGYRKVLTVSFEYEGETVEYSPLSVSLLDKEQLEKLRQMLA